MIKGALTFLCFILATCAIEGQAADIHYSWDDQTLRADGSVITGVKTYRLTYSVNNVDTVIELNGNVLNHTLLDVTEGTYTAYIQAGEDGNYGEPSAPITLVVSPVEVDMPARVIIRGDFTNCNNCGLEVQ